MGKILAKALKDAIKEQRCILGGRQVLGSLKDSKLLVISASRPEGALDLREAAGDAGVQTVDYAGSSVALGKLCGVQFRVLAASLTSVADPVVKSIIGESKGGK